MFRPIDDRATRVLHRQIGRSREFQHPARDADGWSTELGEEAIGVRPAEAHIRARETARRSATGGLGDWSFTPQRGGLSGWATLPEQASATAFVQHASRHGVLIASGRQFCAVDADCPTSGSRSPHHSRCSPTGCAAWSRHGARSTHSPSPTP